MKPGQCIVVHRYNGLGLNATSISRHVLGARIVIASDISRIALRRFGANYAGLPDVIMALLVGKKLLVNVIADLVGVQLTFDAGIDAKDVRLGATTVEIRPLTAAMKQSIVKTRHGADLVDL